MNSLIVCHCTLCTEPERNEPNQFNRKSHRAEVGYDGVRKAPNVYSIVNLICSKMRKLNFKLNYSESNFYLFDENTRDRLFVCSISILRLFSLCKCKRQKNSEKRKFNKLFGNVISYHRQIINQHVQRSKMYLNPSFEFK